MWRESEWADGSLFSFYEQQNAMTQKTVVSVDVVGVVAICSRLCVIKAVDE